MSTHIGASPGEIAETVLISGDPLRAQYVAGQMLAEVQCYNEIRGMLGFTGTFQGTRVSVQGTGIGIPSTAIYVHELIQDYGVKRIIRIGTCGALQPQLPLDQIILASQAYTDSGTHLLHYPDHATPSAATPSLLATAKNKAETMSVSVIEGPIFSTDLFYHDDLHRWDRWKEKGILAIEMETSILYALARQYSIEALTILSVSDNLLTHAVQSARDREEASREMMELALSLA